MTHFTSFVPVYYLRGATPPLLDLLPDHCGWLVCLCLQQMGDTCLLPIAWETYQITPDDPRTQDPLPPPSLRTQSLDQQALALTLADLQRTGWQINGRFTLHFTGQDTDPNFHQTTLSYLWQTPEKNEGRGKNYELRRTKDEIRNS